MADEKLEPNTNPLDMRREQIRVERAEQRVTNVADIPLPAKSDDAQQVNQFHSTYQNYLFNSAGEHAKPAWSDSASGRAAIRVISRGIVGAAAFTIGGRISRSQLMNYNPEEVEFSLEMVRTKPLQLMAKGFDVVFGKPIASMARGVAKLRGRDLVEQEKAGWNAVNFRTKAYYHVEPGKANARSLGSEMVAVSFDFAMSSIGDASTRNFFQMVDPNIQKTWMVNDQGKMAKHGERSHFSPIKFTQSLGRSTWRVFSKNQGEDWAAALPYVYQMKAQRGLISKAFGKEGKGVKLVFDNGWNGGAYKINHEGKIIGDYQLAGAIDLHTRFVGYNVYTLMFREGYDTINNAYQKWKDHGYSLHVPSPEQMHPLHAAKQAVRYFTKSVIKANIYMTPATIPFWLMRTPQTKWRGAMIYPEAGKGKNAILHKTQNAAEFGEIDNYTNVLNQDTTQGRIFPGGSKHAQPDFGYIGNDKIPNAFGPNGYKGPNDPAIYEHYKPGFNTSFSKALNPFGRVSYWLGGKAVSASKHLPNFVQDFIKIEESSMFTPGATRVRTEQGRNTFVRNFVDASLSYTPYMYAKAELGLRVDDHPSGGGPGKMDTAIYKLIDHTMGLNGHGIVQDVKKIWNLSTHIDHRLISREGGVVTPELDKSPKPITPKKIPTTLVHAEGRVHHAPIDLSRTQDERDAKDNLDHMLANREGGVENRWAQSVADQKNREPASPTIH